jgi:hypothetical protein
MQDIAVQYLEIGLLVDVSEHHRCSICETIGAYVLLDKINVLLKRLRFVASTNQVYLMTHYCNRNAKVHL